MTPDQKGSLPLRLEKLFYEMQDRIFTDIVRRIKKTGEITSTADYQINKLLILGNSTEFIESEIKRLVGLTDPEIWELYDKVANWEYVRYADAYEQINGHYTPLEENEQIQQWSHAVINQTQNEIRNITQSLGMTVDMGGKAVFTPLSEYYQTYLDRACMDVVTGAFDYNTVLRRVVKEMTASGLRTIDYASGWNNRVPVAVRRAVMTGVSQLSAQINEMIAKDLRTDEYEVTWHSGHRPSHWWGGRVYTYQELQTVCHLGEGDGLCGWNCRHSYYAFVNGSSVRTYTDEQLAELEMQEQEIKTYQGKEYNKYQASQMQRKLETKMRAQRAKVKQLQQGGADPEDVIAAKARYLNTLHQYQGFSKKMKLPEQMERVYMDGLGRIASGKAIPSVPQRKSADSKDKLAKKRIEQVMKKNESRMSEEERLRKELLNRKYEQLSLEEFKKMHHTVSKEERKILYGKGHFSGYINSVNARKLNKLLREGSDLPKDYQKISNTLSEVIKKNSVQKDIVVTRYVSQDALEAIAGIPFPKSPGLLSGKESSERYWTDIEKLKESIKVGHTYVEKGFLSTSGVSDKNVMSDKKVQIVIKVPKGTSAYVTTNNKESEIIFGIGTKLEVTNVNIENNRTAKLKIILECLMR